MMHFHILKIDVFWIKVSRKKTKGWWRNSGCNSRDSNMKSAAVSWLTLTINRAGENFQFQLIEEYIMISKPPLKSSKRNPELESETLVKRSFTTWLLQKFFADIVFCYCLLLALAVTLLLVNVLATRSSAIPWQFLKSWNNHILYFKTKLLFFGNTDDLHSVLCLNASPVLLLWEMVPHVTHSAEWI